MGTADRIARKLADAQLDDLAKRLAGVRRVSDDLKWPLISRAGNLDTVADGGELFALDPVQAVASGYADPAEALSVARKADLQLLDSYHPRGPLPRVFAGLEDREAPLFVYPNRRSLDIGGTTGVASTDQPFSRMAEAAAKGRGLDDIIETIRHESGHLLDPAMYTSSGPGQLAVRSRIARDVAQQYDPLGWKNTERYWANESEMRATVSRLRRLMSQNRLVTTPAQAKEMLEAARLGGRSPAGNQEARAAFTAEAVLRNKRNMERLMPWMTGALGVGGVMIEDWQ